MPIIIDIEKKFFSKNNMTAKIKRSVTSVLPVAKNRKGRCIRCGACCKLPNVCAFLGTNEQGEHFCKIYKLRPPTCHKYPRTRAEFLTADTCGYTFVDAGD